MHNVNKGVRWASPVSVPTAFNFVEGFAVLASRFLWLTPFLNYAVSWTRHGTPLLLRRKILRPYDRDGDDDNGLMENV